MNRARFPRRRTDRGFNWCHRSAGCAFTLFALVHFFAIDHDVFRRLNSNTDLVTFDTQDRNHNVVTDVEGFVGAAAQTVQ